MTENPQGKPDLVKAGAALSLAGCNLMIAVPMLMVACVLIWCAFSVMFGGGGR